MTAGQSLQQTVTIMVGLYRRSVYIQNIPPDENDRSPCMYAGGSRMEGNTGNTRSGEGSGKATHPAQNILYDVTVTSSLSEDVV
jgi:hypothetical protein